MIRLGERHDGEGRIVRGVRHIRGAGTSPAILAMDSASAAGSLYYVQHAYADVAITSAQVKALVATPQVLVAAPGAGYFLEFCGAQIMLDYGGSNAFTEASVTWLIRYTGTSGAALSQAIEMTGFITGTADTYTTALPKIDAIVAATAQANQALVLDGETAEVAGNAAGDNVVRVRVFYKIHQALA